MRDLKGLIENYGVIYTVVQEQAIVLQGVTHTAGKESV